VSPTPDPVARVDGARSRLDAIDQAIALALGHDSPNRTTLEAARRQADRSLTDALHAYNHWLASQAPAGIWPDAVARHKGA
jgi:hypothetical protein